MLLFKTPVSVMLALWDQHIEKLSNYRENLLQWTWDKHRLNLLFLPPRGPGVVWWWLLLGKPHSCALSLTASSVVSSLSLLCLVPLGLGAILWTFGLLSSCACFFILIHMGVWFFACVSSILIKKVADIIAPKLSIIFRRHIDLGSLPECWRSANVTCYSQGCSILR